jgi:membrane protease YdiL (CAAX protease family)
VSFTGVRRELKAFALYAILIAAAETVTAFYDPRCGLLLHSLLLASLLALSALWHGANPASSLLLSLSLAPLTRIVSLSLPLAYFPRYAWYLVASAPVLAAAATVMRVQGMSLNDVGITLRRPLAQACMAAAGVPFGAVEYFILRPEPLAAGLPPGSLALLAAALIFSTGFVEELVFRGILQGSAVRALGEGAGVVGSTAVFAALHIGWLSALDVIFVFSVGLLFGLATLKTGSIIGASLSHGVTNVVLFLAMPSLPQILLTT